MQPEAKKRRVCKAQEHEQEQEDIDIFGFNSGTDRNDAKVENEEEDEEEEVEEDLDVAIINSKIQETKIVFEIKHIYNLHKINHQELQAVIIV